MKGVQRGGKRDQYELTVITVIYIYRNMLWDMDKQEVGDQVRRQTCWSCWRKRWIRALETVQSKKMGLEHGGGGIWYQVQWEDFQTAKLNSCVRTTSETVKLPIGCWKFGPFLSTHHHRTRPFRSGLDNMILHYHIHYMHYHDRGFIPRSMS